MLRPELTVEQVIELVRQLPLADKKAVFSVLHEELDRLSVELEAETREWLDADLGDNLPPYDWGSEGVPSGQSVQYVPEVGIVITGESCA